MNEILWQPSRERIARSHLDRFRRQAPGSPEDYAQLLEWSTTDLERFWRQVWDFSRVIASRPPDEVLDAERMPGTRWFPGARLNFAENLLRRRDDAIALIEAGEVRDERKVTYAELTTLVARAQAGLRSLGVGPGDRVVAYLPNCAEAVITMLAAAALGAVFSSTSPDFGAGGVVDRFGQIEPKVLVTADGYRYGGKTHLLCEKIEQILKALPSVEEVVAVTYVGERLTLPAHDVVGWAELLDHEAAEPDFAQLPFEHPLYVLYSSGTTARPKSIVHSAGGTLLQHLKEHLLHTDLHAGEDVLFWFTTCGWMMWNWLVSALACEATIVLYDGSPTQPNLEVLWRLAEHAGITHFGTSPKFLAACEQAGLRPAETVDLSKLAALLSTGAPLNPDQFDYVYDAVKRDVRLSSISGGTDLVGCFAGGVPTLPVRRGELQARILGMAVEAWKDGRAVIAEKGELVCTRPFPSMPIGLWGDDDGSRYQDAYFAEHEGVWTHGDFIEIRPEGGVIIYGRSDTTLNPGGVRIGTAEIYRAIEPLSEVQDAIVFDRPIDGDVAVVLCVRLADGVGLDDALIARIKQAIRTATTPRHVPREVFAVPEIPYTHSGKKVEKAVRQLVRGEEPANRDSLANPDALDSYRQLPFATEPEDERRWPQC